MSDAIAGYLAELEPRLRGGSRRRRRVLEELEAHLRALAAEEAAAGCTPESAARRAIERFGTPAVVAAAFAVEEARAPSLRRQLRVLALAGALALGIAWAGVHSTAPSAQAHERPPGTAACVAHAAPCHPERGR